MRIWIIILVALGALGAVIFWRLSDKGYVLRFSEDDLKARLEQSLPYEKRYLYIFNVTLDNPRIDLVEGSSRIAGGIDVVVHVKLGGSEKPLAGAVDLSGGLRYDPAQGAFFLTQPQVEKVAVAGIPERYANQANEAISVALAEFYRTRPIYVLEPDTAPKAAAHMFLRNVTVEDEDLVVTLGLNRRAAKEAAMAAENAETEEGEQE